MVVAPHGITLKLPVSLFPMSDTKPEDRAARLRRIKKTSHNVGYWVVRIGLPLLQIAIAFELVQIVEGGFQTIVICVLGLIYCGLRAMSADAAVSSYYSGYLTTYTVTHLAIYLTTEPERKMEDKIEEMMTGLDKNPDPHRRLRTIEFAILNIIFVVPLLKSCLTHLMA